MNKRTVRSMTPGVRFEMEAFGYRNNGNASAVRLTKIYEGIETQNPSILIWDADLEAVIRALAVVMA